MKNSNAHLTLWLTILFITLYSGVSMAIEEPKYTVDSKNKHYEIRNYEPTLVAETTINADFDDAGNKAFKILADYIFGNNTSKAKIDMTAPVSQVQSEKIEMTAPVNLSKGTNGFLVQFTMPAKFNLQTLPKPNDDRVKIRELPKRKVAVFSYSGSWSEKRYKTKLAEFISELEKNNVKTMGEPTFARFNSPFQLWFLRRNEIWLEVVQ
jgi:effector-binding domain-containing protein